MNQSSAGTRFANDDRGSTSNWDVQIYIWPASLLHLAAGANFTKPFAHKFTHLIIRKTTYRNVVRISNRWRHCSTSLNNWAWQQFCQIICFNGHGMVSYLDKGENPLRKAYVRNLLPWLSSSVIGQNSRGCNWAYRESTRTIVQRIWVQNSTIETPLTPHLERYE